MFEMEELEKPSSFDRRAWITDWNIFGRVWGAKHLKNIVLALDRKALSQRLLARRASIHVTHVNKNLKQLVRLGIVYCLDPEVPRVKFYDLTTIGRNILHWIHEYEQENAAQIRTI